MGRLGLMFLDKRGMSCRKWCAEETANCGDLRGTWCPGICCHHRPDPPSLPPSLPSARPPAIQRLPIMLPSLTAACFFLLLCHASQLFSEEDWAACCPYPL